MTDNDFDFIPPRRPADNVRRQRELADLGWKSHEPAPRNPIVVVAQIILVTLAITAFAVVGVAFLAVVLL